MAATDGGDEAIRRGWNGSVGRWPTRGVDALLLSHGADLPWLTGYRAMPLERLTVLVLPREGEAVLVVPALEAPRVPEASGGLHASTLGRDGGPGRDRPSVSSAEPRATLGISDRAWATSLLAFQERLPDATWVAASTVTSRAASGEGRRRDQPSCGPRPGRPTGWRPRSRRARSHWWDGPRPRCRRTSRPGSLAAGHRRVNFAIVGSGPNGASPHHEAGARRDRPRGSRGL